MLFIFHTCTKKAVSFNGNNNDLLLRNESKYNAFVNTHTIISENLQRLENQCLLHNNNNGVKYIRMRYLLSGL